MLISVNLLMIGLPTTQADDQISIATNISHLGTNKTGYVTQIVIRNQ